MKAILDIEQHLRDRGVDPKRTQVVMDKDSRTATFLLYNLSGQLVGYQRYSPNEPKARSNVGRYFTHITKVDKIPKLAVWGVESITKGRGEIFITEGIFDAVKLQNAGKSAIAVLGNNQKILASWLRTLPQKIIAIVDNDQAGMQLAKYADEFYVPPEEFNDLGEMTQSQVNKFLGDIGYAPKEDEMTKEQNSLKFIADLVKGTEFEGKVFLAGGAVRDELMGTSVKDIDLVVAMPDGGIKFANWITKLTDTYSEGSNPVTFERFGTAKFNLRGKSIGGVDISDVDIEVVMTRDEKYEPGSRKPSVVYSDLESDAYRRDLTVNSLFKDIVTGEILDFTGRGIEDITRGVVRTPLDPNETFKEDPLRMLRVVRFAVKYNWKIPRSLVGALKNNAGTLQEISKERIRDELNKILLTDSPDLGLKLMSETGLMKYVIPELDEGRGVKQNEYHKHDVYEHILEVVKNSPAELIPRLSALFHDIGKPATKSVGSDGRVHFYAHEDIGAVMAADIMKRLRYTNDEISSVQNIVQNHMSLKQTGPSGEKATDKQLRRFMARLGNDIVHALGMMHADNISHKDTASMPAQIKNIASKIENLKTTQVSEKPNLPINGNDVIQRLGISPGPMISSLLSVVADAWYENPDITKEDAIRLIKNKYSDIVRTNLARLPDKIENPVTKNRIKPATALKYDKEHPARKLVIKLLQQLLLRDK